MIRKPEQLSYKMMLIAVAGFAAAAAVTYWYFVVFRSYTGVDGRPFLLFWVYVQACVNPFDQAYCQQIMNAMRPADANIFKQGYLLAAGFTALAIGTLLYLIWDWGLRVRPIIIKAGFTVAGMKELLEATKNEIKTSEKGVRWFGDFHLSRLREVNHFLVFGAIGGGKTQTIMPLLRNVMARGDKCVIFDFKGDYTSMAYSRPPGTKDTRPPLILAPHDDRSVIWDIAKDLLVEEDAIEVANRIIPESRDRFFSDSARTVLALCMIYLMKTKPGQWTWWELIEATQLPLETLQKYAQTYHRDALTFLNADYRQVAATISTMAAGLGPVRMLAYGWRDNEDSQAFSLRQWLLDDNTKDRTLVLQRSGRFQDQSEGWISAFLTVMSANVSDVSFGESRERRVWLFLDEFAQLPKVHRFEAMLETGRSKGLACVLGIQGLEQLVTKYSQQMADQIESLVGTKVVAKINVGQTARKLEEQFGQTLFISHRQDVGGHGRLKWMREEKKEPVMHRSEFQTKLGPMLTKKGIYVLVSGLGEHLYRVVVPYSTNKQLRDPEQPAKWTMQLREIFSDPQARKIQEAMTAQEARRFDGWEMDMSSERNARRPDQSDDRPFPDKP